MPPPLLVVRILVFLLVFWKTASALSGQDENQHKVRFCNGNESDSSGGSNLWNVPTSLFVDNMTQLVLELVPGLPYCGSQTEELSVSTSQNFSEKFPPMGFRYNAYLKVDGEFYGTDEYCVRAYSNQRVEIKYCPAGCTVTRPCVHKCSPPGDLISFLSFKRVRNPILYRPRFYQNLSSKQPAVIPEEDYISPHYSMRRPYKEFPCSREEHLTHPFSEEVVADLGKRYNKSYHNLKFRVQTDGRVFYPVLDDFNCPEYREFPADAFCIEGFQDIDPDKPFSSAEEEGFVMSCSLPPALGAVFSLLFGIIMISSSMFLLFILIVYGLLWKQQNIHGWTVMGHATSMFFAYIFLGIGHILGAQYPTVKGTTFCYLNGVLAHFFFLSAFCWLSLISFDLWWTFRSITPATKQVGSRLVIHVLIGWGVPAIVVLLSVGLDLGIGDGCAPIKLAEYGRNACYIAEKSQGIYLYYPVACTLIADVGFFCGTLFSLYNYKKNTRAVAANSQKNGQLLALFVKLFFVMGMTWIFEFFSWFHVGVRVTGFWAAVDIINVLQALAIFVIYVWKKDILDSLEKTYPTLSKHVLKHVRCQCCCRKKEETAEEDRERTKATVLTCSHH